MDPTNLDDLGYELHFIHDLACRGSWRLVLDNVARVRNQSLLTKPHEHLIYLTYNVIALTKLRRFSDAANELDVLDKDTRNVNYRYETYPHHYPNRSGSMVPFVLRWLRAELPFRLGKRQETIDRFYTLLHQIRARKSESEIWIKRENLVMNSIVSHHLSHKEYGVCLDLINELLNRDDYYSFTHDPVNRASLMSKLGFVQMQFGDLDGAKRTFGAIERIVSTNENYEMLNLVERDKALMFMVGKDYESAMKVFEGCIERDGSDLVAINNKALCLMYMRNLSDSIKVIENVLERMPTISLNEIIVVNLCSMYELAYVNHTDVKKTLNAWIARVAPDDFDGSCTRI